MQYSILEQKRHCLECGESIDYRARTDRMFCSDACKNRYHYAIRRSREKFRKVNDILGRNYGILSDLFCTKVKSVNLSELAYKGFNAEYMTSCVRRHSFSECCCYNIRYKMTSNRIFSIETI